jgi:hypothetical protein
MSTTATAIPADRSGKSLLAWQVFFGTLRP